MENTITCAGILLVETFVPRIDDVACIYPSIQLSNHISIHPSTNSSASPHISIYPTLGSQLGRPKYPRARAYETKRAKPIQIFLALVPTAYPDIPTPSTLSFSLPI